MFTYYVALPFVWTKRGNLVAGDAVEAETSAQAFAIAQRLSERSAGAIAFSRTGDQRSGTYEDAVIIASFGETPRRHEEMEWAC